MVLRTALRRSLTGIRYLTPVFPNAATGRVAAVYAQLERDFGVLAPPVALHAAAEDPLVASWATLRESLVADGGLDRVVKEAIATTVSETNTCPYCVQVHSTTGRSLPGRSGPIPGWVAAHLVRTPEPVPPPPFPAEQAAEVIGVATTFQYLNRMVNVFLADGILPPSAPSVLSGPALSVLGRVMRPAVLAGHRPGDALDLVAPTGTDGPAWAAGSPHIGGAFAAAMAVAATAAGSVPEAVRALLADLLSTWDGLPAGLDDRLLTDAVGSLAGEHRATARLAVLTAFAAYRVDDSVVSAFRAERPTDRALLEVTSWAAWSVALTTADRLAAASLTGG
jgi:alkylhydroperoxidase family enzyme